MTKTAWKYVRAYASEFGGTLYKKGLVGDYWFRIPNQFAGIFAKTAEGFGFQVERYTGSLVSPDMMILVWRY